MAPLHAINRFLKMATVYEQCSRIEQKIPETHFKLQAQNKTKKML